MDTLDNDVHKRGCNERICQRTAAGYAKGKQGNARPVPSSQHGDGERLDIMPLGVNW